MLPDRVSKQTGLKCYQSFKDAKTTATPSQPCDIITFLHEHLQMNTEVFECGQWLFCYSNRSHFPSFLSCSIQFTRHLLTERFIMICPLSMTSQAILESVLPLFSAAPFERNYQSFMGLCNSNFANWASGLVGLGPWKYHSQGFLHLRLCIQFVNIVLVFVCLHGWKRRRSRCRDRFQMILVDVAKIWY